MQIASQQKRQLWFLVFVNLIPDSLISFLIVYFNDGTEKIFAFFLILMGLQGIYLALWIKGSLWN